jgi:pilus assembly protein CpaC
VNKGKIQRFGKAGALIGLLALVCLSSPVDAAAKKHRHVRKVDTATRVLLARQDIINVKNSSPSLIEVPLNKSQLIHIDRPFRQIAVGSKDIADVIPLSQNMIYVLGKKLGTTNLTVEDGNGHIQDVLDVSVSYDIPGLRAQLAGLIPSNRVVIHPANGALVLTGNVDSTEQLREILAIADRFAPGQVTNLLSVGGSQQVLLEVKFDEVQRSAEKQLGVNSNWTLAVNSGTIATATGLGASTSAFGTATGTFAAGNYSLSASLEALEKKGMVRELAEPNLVALSGDTASFLAGGEIPIPVVQSITGNTGAATIEFKQFGVGLSFTPTVLSRELVDLVINSEVSALDPTVSVEANGISVPGLKVRRAKTTVELKDGESFAVAGLLQDNFTNGINQVPWLGNVPVLGALFRSTDFQHNQTELVVFITVHLVQPGPGASVKGPSDVTAPSDQLDLFVNGNTEKDVPLPTQFPDVTVPDPSSASNAPSTAPVSVGPIAPPSAASAAATTPAPTDKGVH